ncbi:hypothetical protein J2Z48_000852 [Croceifilum oryzae]|uniref:DM13 domain-containing protein n=1 Tax=Croceifilum oryzae TaxID=1553429 RepID=A0AAJ1TL88_9BACL|nr:DM13 domain-containing protein [Croceifilum oryzae]MDQ0416685.1 hypothetical protein [Croceifilum oryzae]
MKKNTWKIISILFIVLVGVWFIFRPEKLFIDKTVNEALQTPTGQTQGSKILYQSQFHSGDTFHKGKGTATIHQLENGKRILRFTEFETDNGPDVKIYLVALPEINKSKEVTKDNFISLGQIKGNKGDQNYEIPDNVDLNKYQTVSIWCERFSVNFASASFKKGK